MAKVIHTWLHEQAAYEKELEMEKGLFDECRRYSHVAWAFLGKAKDIIFTV